MMIEKIGHSVARRPWFYIIAFVAVAVALGAQIPRSEVDPDVKNQLPRTMPARVNLDKIENLFGGQDILMIIVEADDVLAPATLRRVQAISQKVERLYEVDRVLSLFELKDIKNVDEKMLVDPAVKEIPQTAEQREQLRADLKDNDMIYGNVLSTDFKATAVIGLLKGGIKDEVVVAAAERIVKETPGPEAVHIAGMPLIRKNISQDIRGDMRKFMPFGLLVMLVFLLLSFKQIRGVLLPFFMVVMSILVAMGLIPLFGWKIMMITTMLPVILIAISNNYGIHIFARYQEYNTPGNELTSRELASTIFRELVYPIIVTGVTTIAGLLCMLSHIIIPAKQMGLLSSIGVAFALIGSLLFITAVLALLPKSKPLITAGGDASKMGLMDRVLTVLARLISGKPKQILLALVGVTVVVAIGLRFIIVDTNAVHYFPDDHPMAVASGLSDKHFGGAVPFAVVVEGDIKHPDVLNRLCQLEEQVEALPQVDITASIAKVIREMNKSMNYDRPEFDRIPDTRNGVAQLLLMYENSGEPEDFDRLVDFPYRHALFTGRINTTSSQEQVKVIRFVRAYVKEANLASIVAVADYKASAQETKVGATSRAVDDAEESPFTLVDETASQPASKPQEEESPFTLVDETASQPATAPAETVSSPEGRGASAVALGGGPSLLENYSHFSIVGGMGVLFNDLVDAVVMGQVSSLLLSLLLVAILVGILFRSPIAGLLSGGTLSFAMVILFGAMGLLKIELNIATAMLSSIVIGVGVDYTIHFLWRYREERRAGKMAVEAVMRTLTTTGRGIIINAFSVIIGFAVLLVSSFVPIRYFGFLVVVSILACLLGAMVLMPTVVLLFKPKFLEPAPPQTQTTSTLDSGG